MISTDDFHAYLKPNGLVSVPKEKWMELSNEKRDWIKQHNNSLRDTLKNTNTNTNRGNNNNNKSKNNNKERTTVQLCSIEEQECELLRDNYAMTSVAEGSNIDDSDEIENISDSHVAASGPVTMNKKIFFADSACTHHVNGSLQQFKRGTMRDMGPNKIRTVAGTKMISKYGTVPLGISNVDDTVDIELTAVRYVPGSEFNLISIGQLCRENSMCIFTDKEWLFVKSDKPIARQLDWVQGNVIMSGPKVGNLYTYETNIPDYDDIPGNIRLRTIPGGEHDNAEDNKQLHRKYMDQQVTLQHNARERRQKKVQKIRKQWEDQAVEEAEEKSRTERENQDTEQTQRVGAIPKKNKGSYATMKKKSKML